jgi:hypothetical protein
MKTSLAFLLVPALVLAGALPVLRSGDRAITDLSKVDARYAYVGEYVATTSQGEIGVRISTQAGKKPLFAKVYPGGLPGLGWGTDKPALLAGTRNGEDLSLESAEGAQRKIRSAGKRMLLVEPNGQEIELRKIARRSVTQGKPAPSGAKVMFDGKDTSSWKDAKVTDEGYLKAGTESVDPLVAGHLHVEFRTPYMPESTGQKRGNSGVYLQRRYEVQILESFALEGIENECGAIYRQRRPDLNMSLPPLVWQTYDIFFEPAVFSSKGEKLKGTELTVVHNGVPVHYHTLVVAKTGAGREEGAEPLPLLLQDHSDPIVFRNIWFVPRVSLPMAPSAQGSNSLSSVLAPTQPIQLPRTVVRATGSSQ